ncbi:TRAP transporter small permease [Chelativorans xinjiangense]|uniref:TRAP transporter small permease n=1 Tax=Chelativorans xinjiangense TaxID=2681485 RepID=UPI00135BA137|nr:TRAP transporter small permease subunit [Chelativorans xinjiangense]
MPNRLHTALITLCRLAVGLSFAILIFAVLVQVLGRSVFSSSPVWTEELTRFALLYLAAFGAGLSYRSGDLVNVDIVSEALPGRLPVLLRFLSAAATVILCAALILPAWRFTVIGSLQTSPALGWRMSFIHASVLVLIVSLLVFAVMRAVAMLAGRSDGRSAFNPDLPQ